VPPHVIGLDIVVLVRTLAFAELDTACVNDTVRGRHREAAAIFTALALAARETMRVPVVIHHYELSPFTQAANLRVTQTLACLLYFHGF
jgi:hypothetical protein